MKTKRPKPIRPRHSPEHLRWLQEIRRSGATRYTGPARKTAKAAAMREQDA